MTRSAGFTAMELMVVLVLLSLISTAVVVTVRATYASRSFEDAIDTVRHVDQLLRRGGGSLAVDLDRGTLALKKSVEEETRRLPRGVELARLYFIDRTLRIVRGGRQTLSYSERGHSQSYALVLKGGEKSRTLLFAGLSGQCSEYESEKEAHDTLKALLGLHAR